MSDHELKKGTIIYSVGEPGDCMYHILWGKVTLVSRDPKTGRKKVVERFAGDYFGERGLIDHEARSEEAVVSEKDTVIARVGEEEFGKYLANNPSKVHALFQQLSRELRKVTNDYLDVCQSVADAMGPGAKPDAQSHYGFGDDDMLRDIHDQHATKA